MLQLHHLELALHVVKPCRLHVCACSLWCSQPSFLPHYVQIASRKLLLFHGRRNLGPKGRQQQQQQDVGGSSSSDLILRLSDLVNSPVMAELQELLLLGPGAEQERDLYSNWFSLQVCAALCCALLGSSYVDHWPTCIALLVPHLCWLNMPMLLLAAALLLLPLQSTQRVLATFNAWDLDGNGTLSKTEFSAISQVGAHSSAAHASTHNNLLVCLSIEGSWHAQQLRTCHTQRASRGRSVTQKM